MTAPARLIWALALGLAAALWLWGQGAFPLAFDYPKAFQIPAARWIGGAISWLVNDAALGPIAFSDLTRAVSAVIDLPYRAALALLAEGVQRQEAGQILHLVPPLSWLAVIASFALFALWAGGRTLAALVTACLIFVAIFGHWQATMVTLASIVVAVPLGVAGGLGLGILAWRHPWFDRALRPFLDLMQTMPVFAYLVPILILFGFGPTAAVIATLIYATPPMTRITTLSLARVPSETHDLATMVGCTPRQRLWRVLIPSAREPLLVGVNQVSML